MTREEQNKDKQKEIFKEQNKETAKKIVKVTLKILTIIIVISTIFFVYTTYVSTVQITTREYRIINKKIPSSFNGIKIVQFSDLHYGTTINETNIKNTIKRINELEPDIIVFTGDLINKTYEIKNKENESIIKQLTKLKASLGKYAILGEEDNEIAQSILVNSNFTILKNEYELLYNNDNNPILLIGLNNEDKNSDGINKAYNYYNEEIHNPDIYSITLTHKPDEVDKINLDQTNIILAGHSHNGNIRIPFINKSIINPEGAKKYNQDYYKINNSKLYISSGLGTNNSSGIRLFCRPSINLFRISNK